MDVQDRITLARIRRKVRESRRAWWRAFTGHLSGAAGMLEEQVNRHPEVAFTIVTYGALGLGYWLGRRHGGQEVE